MLRLVSQDGPADQRPEPLNEPAPLDPWFTGCVKVCVVVGDGGKPAEVQQEDSLQHNTAARLQPALHNRLMSGVA